MSVQEFPQVPLSGGITQTQTSANTGERTAVFDRESMALMLVLSLALVSHAFNMFNYPLYRQDEGIVSQQAWSFIKDFQLSPYTFNYEHPPFATFMLAAWTLLTGGFHTFGDAVNSGRVLMLVLHLGSTYFLYRSARKLSDSLVGAVIAGLLFSLSPLAINYQRLVVVDNFMVFWLVLAFYFLVHNNQRLFNYFLASIALGLAVVTRETAIFFVPAFLAVMWWSSDKYHRYYVRYGTFLITGVIVLQYILYAVFKAELLPDNLNFQAEIDGTANHVSLAGTLWQNYRNSVPIWDNSPQVAAIWQTWLGLDTIFLYAAVGCVIFNLVFGFKRLESWIVPLIAVGYVGFIICGWLDSDYMVVALVPFMAIAIAQATGKVLNLFGSVVNFLLLACCLIVISYSYITNNTATYTANVNQSYDQALSWIKTNIPSDRALIISDALWVDLHDTYRGPAFNNAHSHYKAAQDPAIRVGVFGGDYKNVDYIIVNTEMRQQFQARSEAFPQQVLDNSTLVRQFEGTDAFEIRKVNNVKALLLEGTLTDAYNYYRSHFVDNAGKVSDGQGHITSQQQAQALQLALWNNDQKTFDTTWDWTAFNLQLSNNLFQADNSQALNTSHSAADSYTDTAADTNIALTLLLASKRWGETEYVKQAYYIVDSIWKNEVIVVHNKPYLKATAAAQAQMPGEVLLNVGAFTPQAYRFFAEVDPKHDWMALYKNGYQLLNKVSWYGRGDYNGLGLPSGLVVMNLDSENLRAVDGSYTTKLGNFDEEAQQAIWNVTLDYSWFNSSEAKNYIIGTGWYLIKFWQKWQYLAGEYTNDGLPINSDENLSVYADASVNAAILNQIKLDELKARGQNPVLEGANPETEIIAWALMGSFHHSQNQGYWLQANNLDAQYWGWMASASNLKKLNINFTNGA